MRLKKMMWKLPATLLLASLTAGTQPTLGDARAESYDQFGTVLARGNFNGDRFQDLAVGVPYEDIDCCDPRPTTTIPDAGAVVVIYGAAGGLTSSNRQFWRQGSGGVEDMAEEQDNFGSSLAVGDFNRDGFDDLAIGVRGETLGCSAGCEVFAYLAGAVHVIYGSPNGLSTAVVPDQFWHQDSPNIADAAESRDYFGQSLAAGDFNRDTFDDLAIGAPGEEINNHFAEGVVNVVYGSQSGLSATIVPNQLWHQDSPGVEDAVEGSDAFGSTLVAGDFNRDGCADLAIGVDSESVNNLQTAGAVNVIYGSAQGLSATLIHDQLWTQANAGGGPAAYSHFGRSLASGDFNGDGYSDLAVGARSVNTVLAQSAGAVHVIYGSSVGLSAALVPHQIWHQDAAGVEDEAEAGDGFGWSLAAGDFNYDGKSDLAVGVYQEDINGVFDAGAVNVIYGSLYGLTATGMIDQFWHQDHPEVEDTAEYPEQFGTSVAAGDFNGDRFDDLAIGVPRESVTAASGRISSAGAVNVIYGYVWGLNARVIHDQFWTQIYIQSPQL